MLIAARFVWLYTGSIAAAAVTLTLIALDDSFIWYSTEARPYALLHLASIIQAGCFWQMVEHWRRLDSEKPQVGFNSRSGIFWLLLSSWMVVYTHYTGVFLLATEGCFLLVLLFGWWLSRGFAKGTFEQIFLTLILFVAGCLPIWLQMNQAFGKPADWSSVASLDRFLSEQKINGIWWFGIPFCAVLVSVGMVTLIRRSTAVSNSDRWRQFRWLSWIVVWFATPLLIIVILQSLAGIPIALSRYLSVALIAGPIFAGGVVGIGSVRSRWIAVPIILLMSIFVHWPNNRFEDFRNNRLIGETVLHGRLPLLRTENWQAAIEVVSNRPDKAGWPLFLFAAVIEDENALLDSDAKFQAYLQFPVRSLYQLDSRKRVVFAGPTISQQHFDDRYLDEVISQGGAWILIRHEPEITHEIANQLVSMLQDRLDNPNATLDTNWFGNRDNVVRLISVEIKQ